MNLIQKHCVPCEGGTLPLSKTEAQTLLKQVSGWQLSEDAKKISREFTFKDFKETLMFINKVAVVAESEGHHPDIHIFYNRVKLELWTHSIDGLSENDFILASKINHLLP